MAFPRVRGIGMGARDAVELAEAWIGLAFNRADLGWAIALLGNSSIEHDANLPTPILLAKKFRTC